MKAINQLLFSYILLIVCIILLASCQKYPVSQAVKDLNKANVTYPSTVKKWVDEKHPCFPFGAKTDSSAYYEAKRIADSIQALYDYEKSKMPEIQYLSELDTAACIEECNKRILQQNNAIALRDKNILSLKNELVRLRNSPIHDTVIDNRKVNSLLAENEELKQDNAKKEAENQKLKRELAEQKEKTSWWRKWCLITWGLIVIYLGLKIAIPKIPFLNR